MSDKQLEDRIIELEVRLSFQNSTIDALNSVISAQQTQIEQLSRNFEELKSYVLNPENMDPSIVRPPHY